MQYTLHLTEYCNLSCAYCGQKRSGRSMCRKTALAAAGRALSENVKTVGIGFYGGEPLLCKDTIEAVVRYVREKNTDKHVFFKLITNGLLLDKAFLTYAKREHVLISFSIDGTREAHNKNRCGSYDEAVKPVPALLESFPYAAAMMTVSPNTVSLYADGVKNLFSLGFRTVVCSLNYSASWMPEHFVELEKQYKKLARLYCEKTLAGEKFFLSPFDGKINSHIRNREYCGERCRLGYDQLSVAADGSFYPCIQFVNDSRYKIGDVFQGVDSVRRKEIFRESRIRQPECETCALKERCLHTCACLNKYSTGSLSAPSPVLCAHERILIPIADRAAAQLYRKRNGLFIHKHYNDFYPLLSLVEDAENKRSDDK